MDAPRESDAQDGATPLAADHQASRGAAADPASEVEASIARGKLFGAAVARQPSLVLLMVPFGLAFCITLDRKYTFFDVLADSMALLGALAGLAVAAHSSQGQAAVVAVLRCSLWGPLGAAVGGLIAQVVLAAGTAILCRLSDPGRQIDDASPPGRPGAAP